MVGHFGIVLHSPRHGTLLVHHHTYLVAEVEYFLRGHSGKITERLEAHSFGVYNGFFAFDSMSAGKPCALAVEHKPTFLNAKALEAKAFLLCLFRERRFN